MLLVQSRHYSERFASFETLNEPVNTHRGEKHTLRIKAKSSSTLQHNVNLKAGGGGSI